MKQTTKKHASKKTTHSANGLTVTVQLQVDRRNYEFARELADAIQSKGHGLAAEDVLERYLDVAMIDAQERAEWSAKPEIEKLYVADWKNTAQSKKGNSIHKNSARAIIPNLDRDIPF